MAHYIDAEKLTKFEKTLADIIVSSQGLCTYEACKDVAKREAPFLITSLQQEQPEVDYLRNKAELIANEIMMGVQANKYHTCIYNKSSNDFNHSHLLRAALKGIELGLNARKEE